MNSFLEAAQKYAARGIPVFPLWPGTKTPYTAHGFHDASTDPRQIDAWWAAEPELNIGFSPHDIGLGVIDLDGPDGENAWTDAQIEYGFAPETWTVTTPRGRHLYFKGEVPPTQSILGQHIDTRGRGSYALLPPSVIDARNKKGPETWGDYRTSGGEIAPMPEWVVPKIASARRAKASASVAELDMPANVDRARTFLKGKVATGQVAETGDTGDKMTYVTACEMLNLGLSVDTTVDLMSELWNPSCLPPWAEDELRVKIENAGRYAQNDAGAWGVETGEQAFGEALDRLLPTLPPSQPSRFAPLSEDEQDHLPEPEWLLPDLIPADSTVMLYGPSGSFKSFIALDIALTLASGIPGFGDAERPAVDVVYVSGEGSRSIARKRRPAWRVARSVDHPVGFHLIADMPSVADPSAVAEMVREIEARKIKPRLIVLDTLARAMLGLDESFAKDAGLTVKAVECLKRTFGCSVLVVHHTGKDESRGARGSSALLAAFDATHEVKRAGRSLAVEVWNRKQKDAEERKAPWTFEGKEVGPSLVFFATDGQRHDELTGKASVSPRAVARALSELGAVDESHCVPTMVLAMALIPDRPDASEEVMAGEREELCRDLARHAKTRLATFATGRAQSLRWSTISSPAPAPA